MTKSIITGIIASVAAFLIVDRIKAIRAENDGKISAALEGLGATETQTETWV